MRTAKCVVTAVGGLALGACSVQGSDEQQAAEPADEVAVGVTREETPASPPSTPSPTPLPVIQTQPGPDGISIDLVRVEVIGDIMTVALTYRKPGAHCCEYIKLDQVSVIDGATSQRIGVLKDDTGKWMASPLGGDGTEELRIHIEESAAQVWFRFPAPSVEAKTVSINIPGALPFDAVPVTR